MGLEFLIHRFRDEIAQCSPLPGRDRLGFSQERFWKIHRRLHPQPYLQLYGKGSIAARRWVERRKECETFDVGCSMLATPRSETVRDSHSTSLRASSRLRSE